VIGTPGCYRPHQLHLLVAFVFHFGLQDMAESEEKAEILERLVQERGRICADPTALLSEHIKMLRQAYFKASYTAAQGCRVAIVETPLKCRARQRVSTEYT